jgi:uncharacterized PurR-regulated membrane protein YhhQ (DUF165 family)
MNVSYRFVVIAAVFVTSLVTANLIAVKLVDFGSVVLPAAIIVFPLSYIFGDILTEVYGFRLTRRVIWLGFACNLIFVAFVWLGGCYRQPPSGRGKPPTILFWVMCRESYWPRSSVIWWVSLLTPIYWLG